MIINNNIAALNTFNRYAVNQKRSEGSLAKLSSGLRIASAADDSAGLAISEKMRGQIRGLHQASRNAQDGVGLIQTAEGGLSETQSILERLKELAVQATTDTYSAADRAVIQDEVDRLTQEITTIAESTTFNAKKLLNGCYDASSGSALRLQIGESDTQTALVNIAAMDADALGLTAGSTTSGGGGGGSVTKTDGSNITSSVSGTPAFAQGGRTVSFTYTPGTAGTPGTPEVITSPATKAIIQFVTGNFDFDAALDAASDLKMTLTVDNTDYEFTAQEIRDYYPGGSQYVSALTSVFFAKSDSFANFTPTGTFPDVHVTWEVRSNTFGAASSVNLTITGSNSTEVSAIRNCLGMSGNTTGTVYGQDAMVTPATPGTPATSPTVTIADNSGHSVNVTVSDSDTSFSGTGYFSGLSINLSSGKQLSDLTGGGSSSITFIASGGSGGGGTSTGGIDVSTSAGALNAIPVIDNAISKVLGERSNLGALQNRLEHTINNLGTANENLSAAESRIRDTDIAMEMMEYTKENILSQAASAMLAQANRLPQQVLQFF